MPMTPYEEYNQRMMQEAIRRQALGQPIPPGLMSQSAGPSAAAQGAAVDLTGAERGVAGQRAMAAQLRGRAGPKGKRVGPSGLYVAPNWGESLEHLTNQLAAGYLGKKANEADIDLGAQREAKNAAGLAYTAELLAGERGYKTDERVAGQDFRTGLQDDQQLFTGTENEYARGLQESIANLDRISRGDISTAGITSREGIADQSQTEQSLRDVTETSFFNPKAGESGESPVLTYRVKDGRVVGNDNMPIDVTNMTPYKAISPQSLDLAGSKPTAAQIEDAADAQAGLTELTSRFPNMTRLAQYSLDDVNDFTGYNPQALAGKYGQGPEGVKAQQFSSMMSAEEVGGLLPAVKAAKLTPVSDTDVDIVREKFVNARSQPGTISQFYAYEGRQFMDRTIKHNENNGSITKAEGAEILADYDKQAATLALNWGYEPKHLITAGMDPDLIKYLVEAKKRQGGG